MISSNEYKEFGKQMGRLSNELVRAQEQLQPKELIIHGLNAISKALGGVSERTIWRWRKRFPTFPVVDMGSGAMLASVPALHAWIERHSGLPRFCPCCRPDQGEEGRPVTMSWDVSNQQWYCPGCRTFIEDRFAIVHDAPAEDSEKD